MNSYGEHHVQSLKNIINELTPPIIVKIIRKLRNNRIKFSGKHPNWQSASESSTGYDDNDILQKVLSSTLKVINGDAAFERDSVTFNTLEYSWPLTAALTRAAAHSKGTLNVLDFGGSLGSSYFQNIKFIKTLSSLKWNIVEQTHFVKAGRHHIQNESLSFYSSIEECLLENRPNAILFSSVLQYLEKPEDILKKIDLINAESLIIDRTPISDQMEDRIVIQHVPPKIYKASYPMRIFSEKKLLALLAEKWELVAETPCTDGTYTLEDSFQFSFKGFIFERKHG